MISDPNSQMDRIITKIYEFKTKIVHKENIYESNYTNYLEQPSLTDSTDPADPTEQTEYELSPEILEYQKKISDLETAYKSNQTELGQIENLYKLTKKYKKHVNDNVRSLEIKNTLNNFSFIRTLIKKISDPTKKQLDIDTFLKYDFTDKFTTFKISNRLDKTDYDVLIEKYFDDNLEAIVDNLLDIYNLDDKYKQYLYIYIEIVIRIYIDLHLGHQSYCLAKHMADYIGSPSMYNEPDTVRTNLKKRFWDQLFSSNDSKQVITNLIYLLNNKTKTIDQTLKYLLSFDNISKTDYASI